MGVTRWGILSTARINRRVLEGCRGSDEVEFVAVASRHEERARGYAAEWGIPKAHASYEALLADADVDAVYVPLPNALHVDWSIRALEAGKHVLCEKPLARSPREVERAFDAAERAGRLLMEAFMYRHHPQTRRLVELVADGAIGEPRLVLATFSFPLTDLADVRMRADLDGGSLMDVGCYCVSAARLLAGEPERVTAEQVLARSGVDVRFTGTLRFAGDVLAHFDCGLDLPLRHVVEVVGSEGTLRLDDPWHARRPGLELRRGDGVERIDVPDLDRYRLQLEHFGRALRGEEEPLLGRPDAVGQARALDALSRAAAEGVAVAP